MKQLYMCVALLLLANLCGAQTESTIRYYDQNGLPIGKAKVKTTATYQRQPYQGSKYVSSMPPLELLYAAGQAKQQLFDERVKWIQSRIDAFGKMIATLQKESPTEAAAYWKNLEMYVEKVNKGSYDLSENRVFNGLAKEIDDLHQNAYSAYLAAYNSNHIIIPIETMLRNSDNSPAAFIGSSWGEAEQKVKDGGKSAERGVADSGRPYISYDADDEKNVTLYYENSQCVKYMLQAHSTERNKAEAELGRLYKKVEITSVPGVTFAGMWLDESLNVRWSMEIAEEEAEPRLIIVAKKL